LLEDFGRGYWQPLRESLYAAGPQVQSELAWDTRTPPVDVVETEEDYEITAELPGVDENCIEVKVANDNLVIKVEKMEEKVEKKTDYYLRERNFGLFERGFVIPESVDVDEIKANYRKGILTVTLPKKARGAEAEQEDRGQGLLM